MVTKKTEWYWRHREEQIKKNREWKIKNRERMLAQKKEYHLKHRDEILARKKEYRKTERAKELKKKDDKLHWQRIKNSEPHKIKRREQRLKYFAKEDNMKKRIEYLKEYNQRPHVKARAAEKSRIRRRNNPQSNRRGSIDLQLAMNNVRKRDHNTCQWQGCGLTFRQSPIHVHHIFPRSEYPDFELIEQYMICYCANHHGLWHRMRGDKYSEMIPARYQEDQLTTLRGRD